MAENPVNSDGPGAPGRRSDVLRALKASSEPMSIVQLANVLDVHPNTVRFHLEALEGQGSVERVEPTRKRPGRPALLFRPIPQMDRGGTRRYRLLAEILTAGLAEDENAPAKALAAGRAWGERAAASTASSDAVDDLVALLDDLGFAPERRDCGGEKQIGLRHCPFLELAETRANVVCPIHLGLMQGALHTWGAPLEVERLDSFVEPDLCLAQLSATR